MRHSPDRHHRTTIGNNTNKTHPSPNNVKNSTHQFATLSPCCFSLVCSERL